MKQSRYFTFDGNTIFNPKNPVSPARGHLATIFVRQKLGKERYEKVLQILSENEDPLKLLELTTDLNSAQRNILSLINEDLNFIPIFKYIVKSS